MLIGYARVSTTDQRLDLQLDALAEAGADRVFKDTASGAKSDRPGLAEALAFAREGDTIVVWRLDRFGRSLKDLVTRIDELRDRGVGFRSLTEGIDTTSPAGRLVMHLFGSLAEFERELIRERTVAGLESARAQGGTSARDEPPDGAPGGDAARRAWGGRRRRLRDARRLAVDALPLRLAGRGDQEDAGGVAEPA